MNELNRSLGIMNRLLVDIQEDLSDEEYQVLKRNIAKVMNLADIKISQGIIAQYPDLSIDNNI